MVLCHSFFVTQFTAYSIHAIIKIVGVVGMNTINKLLEKYGQTIFYLFFFCGPIFDLVTSLSLHYLGSSMPIVLGIKLLFLVFLWVYAYPNMKNKKMIVLYYAFLLLYFSLFLWLMVQTQDAGTFFYQCQNLIRTFYLPLALPCIICLMKEDKITVDYHKLAYLLLIYLILLFLPIITKSGFNSYAYSKEGNLGWFYSTNEIGGILSILMPYFFLVLWQKKSILSLLFAVIFMFTCFSLGTKVPILSTLIVFGILFFYFSYQLWKQKKRLLLMELVLVLLIGLVSVWILLPKTSFYKNIQIHLDFLDIHSVSDLMTFNHIDHFVFSSRLQFLLNTKETYDSASIPEKLFGIGYIENYATDKVSTKTIEMDYYDIFYRHGIIGMLLFFVPICATMLKKRTLTTSISMLLIFLLAFFSGHILVAPSVSFLVGIILTRKEELHEDWFYNCKLQ